MRLWGEADGALCPAANLCFLFQPVPARPRLAAAVALGPLRAADRGAAQVPPQSPLRDGGQPGRREGVGRGTPQRAGTVCSPVLLESTGNFVSMANGASSSL